MILQNNGGFTGLRVRPTGNSSAPHSPDKGSEYGAAPAQNPNWKYTLSEEGLSEPQSEVHAKRRGSLITPIGSACKAKGVSHNPNRKCMLSEGGV